MRPTLAPVQLRQRPSSRLLSRSDGRWVGAQTVRRADVCINQPFLSYTSFCLAGWLAGWLARHWRASDVYTGECVCVCVVCARVVSEPPSLHPSMRPCRQCAARLTRLTRHVCGDFNLHAINASKTKCVHLVRLASRLVSKTSSHTCSAHKEGKQAGRQGGPATMPWTLKQARKSIQRLHTSQTGPVCVCGPTPHHLTSSCHRCPPSCRRLPPCPSPPLISLVPLAACRRPCWWAPRRCPRPWRPWGP